MHELCHLRCCQRCLDGLPTRIPKVLGAFWLSALRREGIITAVLLAEDEDDEEGGYSGEGFGDSDATGIESADDEDDDDDSEGWRTADEDVGGSHGSDAEDGAAHPAGRGGGQERHVSGRTVHPPQIAWTAYVSVWKLICGCLQGHQ